MIVGVVLATFLLIHLVPGDPALSILGIHATPESLAALRREMHLDRPFFAQLWLFIQQLARGDLGQSLVQQGRPVTGIVFPAMRITLMLTFTSVVFSLLAGIPLALTAALLRRRGVDFAIRSFAALLLATPPFMVGFVLLILIALKAGLAPAGGWGTGFGSDLPYLWLPALALSAFLTPIVTRAVRQSALETNEQQFVEAAIARGLGHRALILRHVLPNSLLPVITLVGVNVGGLIGGAVVIEAVFNLPGTGTVLVQAVEARDYPVVQGVALAAAVLVVLISLLADVLYFLVDPRTRSNP